MKFSPEELTCVISFILKSEYRPLDEDINGLLKRFQKAKKKAELKEKKRQKEPNHE